MISMLNTVPAGKSSTFSRRFMFGGALALVLGACAPQPASIEVNPANVTMNEANESMALAGSVKDKNGKTIEKSQIMWSSSDAGIAEVDAGGNVMAKGSGSTTVTAKVGQITASVPVTVAIYQEVKVGPMPAEVKMGEALQLTAQILDEKGMPVAGSVTWASSDENTVKLEGEGMARGVTAGSAKVTATAKKLSGSVDVTVMAADAMPADGAAPADPNAAPPAGAVK